MSAETLRKAAAIVRERGLAKGVNQDTDGRVCLYGAFAMADHGNSNDFGMMPELVRDALSAVTGQDRFRLSVWNDEFATTAEDVAAAFEAAAAAIESQTDDDAGANPGAVPTR